MLQPLKRLAAIAAILCTGVLVSRGPAQSVGDVLPPFVAGGLDIHHINTGEGSAAFLVLPDGTTWIIDCGFGEDIIRPPKYKAPRKPDESRTPGEWVARYIRRVHPRGPDAQVDYALISHFHGDHMGGIPVLLRHIRVATFLDRGAPNYDVPPIFTGPSADAYLAALRAHPAGTGMRVERFKAGANDQIVLRHAREKFPSFEVRNLAVNGEAWTGQGTEVRRRFDQSIESNENTASAALRVRFGRFDYYTGGDLTGASTRPTIAAARDVESAIAWSTGPVDVAVLDHHGNSDSSGVFFLSVLQPRVAIAQTWATPQLDPEALARLLSERTYPGPRDIFTTNGLWDGRVEHLIRTMGEEPAARHIADLRKIAADQGHIVVRVAPGGDSYRIFVLDDSNESMRIRSSHGPYDSR